MSMNIKTNEIGRHLINESHGKSNGNVGFLNYFPNFVIKFVIDYIILCTFNHITKIVYVLVGYEFLFEMNL